MLARGYYKGGFEPKMNRKEASLILEMQYVYSFQVSCTYLFAHYSFYQTVVACFLGAIT